MLSPPCPLAPSHDVSGFNSGKPSLDNWLRQKAGKNETAGASRTFVTCEDNQVIGYYSLATGSVESKGAPGKVRRNMPDPIPVILLARLAVDTSQQGRGAGKGLLKDAILRTVKVADDVGVRALLVHALDDDAAAFYRGNGFLESPLDPLVLMLPIDTICRAL